MADMLNGHKAHAQSVTLDESLAQAPSAQRDRAGPAGGLLIAVGTSLILWAALVQIVRMASWILF